MNEEESKSMNDETGKAAKPENQSATMGASVESTIAAPAVDWDDSEMRSTYANVVNASSTREEVTVFFGSNLTWNPATATKLHVKLTDRIILNPHAAKRLWILLGAILNQYEKRFGKIEVDATTGTGTGSGADNAGRKG